MKKEREEEKMKAIVPLPSVVVFNDVFNLHCSKYDDNNDYSEKTKLCSPVSF